VNPAGTGSVQRLVETLAGVPVVAILRARAAGRLVAAAAGAQFLVAPCTGARLELAGSLGAFAVGTRGDGEGLPRGPEPALLDRSDQVVRQQESRP
jgi:hypothetical protein